MKKSPDPFFTGVLSEQEARAIKSVARGEADQYQQQLACKVIIDKLSAAHNLTYAPDSFDKTAFMAGRAFVGKQLLRVINSPLEKLNKGAKSDE